MRQTEYSQIDFGPGGLIRDVPENRELLEEIREARPLSSIDLLKLAAFYRGYPTNQPLGDHLALIALTMLVGEPEIQKDIREVVTRIDAAAGKMPTARANDQWELEDFDLGFSKESDDPPEGTSALEVKWISYSGVGLLIETPYRKDHHRKRHYVIGVSPNPASLPTTKRKRA